MLEKMRVQVQEITPTQAKLLQAHRSRQARYAFASRRVGANKLREIEVSHRLPMWKSLATLFDAHIRAYQFHLANKCVRREVKYIKQRCGELGVQYRDVVGRSAIKRVVAARRQLMWEVREKFGLAYADVGRAFGDRDQSTAMSAIKVHETCEASERNSKKQPLWNK
ncbi:MULTISPECIES: helix-turn-helix domain-containing protein [Neorhizobium]|jgi:hypothetical protein|uniref:helix-turn-helix domain-containing protein n=1 Tax=Neorhizobium sp. T6_25 TaxID=2093833 RepID=UPI000CFA095D|nr:MULTISPECIES: helix-turn-helix domain-containing protein [Neorhizobium]